MEKDTLKIADGFSLSVDVVTSTVAILSKRRVGKTYTASVIAEEMCAAGIPWVAFDPTGAWWGFRADQEGNPSDRFPVIIIGGAHGDIPLEYAAGKVIAELVTDFPGHYVIDLSGADSQEDLERFSLDFFARFFILKQHKRSPIHLFIDEADTFAPQVPVGKRQNQILKAVEKIVRQGGILGIGQTLITQRPAVLNNNVLMQADALIVLQMTGPADQKAIQEWVKQHGTDAQLKAMKQTLASLPTGVAWYWNPGVDIFRQISIRERHTYNSSATPTFTSLDAEATPVSLAEINLGALRERMAESFERAKQNDPDLLREEISALRRQLESHVCPEVEPTAPTIQTVEVPVLTEDDIRRMQDQTTAVRLNVEAWLNTMADQTRVVTEAVDRLHSGVDNRLLRMEAALTEMQQHAGDYTTRTEVLPLAGAGDSAPEPMLLEVVPAHGQDFANNAVIGARHHSTGPIIDKIAVRAGKPKQTPGILPVQQRIIDAIKWFNSVGIMAPSRKNIAAMIGASAKSSSFNNNISNLRAEHGLVDYPGEGLVGLTEKGQRAANAPQHKATLRDLHEAWLRAPMLNRKQRAMLRHLLDIHPKYASREELARVVSSSPASSSFNNDISGMSGLGIVFYPKDRHVQAKTALLFPRGL